MKGAAGISNEHVFWKWRISRRATVPGLKRRFFLCVSGAIDATTNNRSQSTYFHYYHYHHNYQHQTNRETDKYIWKIYIYLLVGAFLWGRFFFCVPGAIDVTTTIIQNQLISITLTTSIVRNKQIQKQIK